MSTSKYLHTAERRKAPAHEQNARGNRILIVEDNPVSLTLLKQLLKAHGYEVLGTPEGLEALDLAREEQPDLILMDIRLPDISGLEVTRLLKQDDRTKAIPIIAVTELASPEYERKGLESGCDAYIPQPITLGNFLRTIEAFLKIRPVTPTSFASLTSRDGLMHSPLASASAPAQTKRIFAWLPRQDRRRQLVPRRECRCPIVQARDVDEHIFAAAVPHDEAVQKAQHENYFFRR